MRSARKTDVGLVRENNEDYLLADDAAGIFMLADGMGGGPAGEVASELAVVTAHALLARELAEGERAVTGRLLAEALAAAHSAVAKRGLSDRSLRGMGTTLEMLVVHGSRAMICHVGDSRVYLFRHHRLRQLTNDDNYASWFSKMEQVPIDEIPSGYRHVLTQAVGVSEEIIPEIVTVDLKPGDLLLICSDGLNGVVSDEEIRKTMARNAGNLGAMAEGLVTAAILKGGPDNVSVIVVEGIPPVTALPVPVAEAGRV